jgi:hypothetical protein
MKFDKLTEAYMNVAKEGTQKYKSYHNLDNETQQFLTRLASNYQIPNLVADQWVRDVVAAAFQAGQASVNKS